MNIKPLFFFVLLITPFTGILADEKIKVTDAWVSEAPPMAKSLAGYLEIHNNGDESVMLRSVTSNMFESAMMHKTEIKNGMATMSHVNEVVIKPHSKFRFEPGGYHIMLMNPKKTLKAGDKVEMTLQFTDNSKVAFTASVKKMSHMENYSDHKTQKDMKMDDSHDMKMDDHDMEEREDMKHDTMPHKH